MFTCPEQGATYTLSSRLSRKWGDTRVKGCFRNNIWGPAPPWGQDTLRGSSCSMVSGGPIPQLGKSPSCSCWVLPAAAVSACFALACGEEVKPCIFPSMACCPNPCQMGDLRALHLDVLGSWVRNSLIHAPPWDPARHMCPAVTFPKPLPSSFWEQRVPVIAGQKPGRGGRLDPGSWGVALWEPRRETEGHREIGPKFQGTLVAHCEAWCGGSREACEWSMPCHRWLGSDTGVTIEWEQWQKKEPYFYGIGGGTGQGEK